MGEINCKSTHKSGDRCGKSILHYIVLYSYLCSGKTVSFASSGDPQKYINNFNRALGANATFEETANKDIYNIKLK